MKISTPGGSDHHQLYQVWTMARKYMDAYGLKKWTLAFSSSVVTAGECSADYLMTITLSAPLMSVWTLTEAEDTVLHEIAHALTPGHHHDSVWKAKAREIGARPEARYQITDGRPVLHKWVGTCPKGHKIYRQRMGPYDLNGSCPKCTKGYDKRYLFKWELNRVD